MTTRVGTIELQVPRLRDGKFSTALFHRYQRSEQALVLAMMENEASLLRLIGALLIEQGEKWSSGKKYLSMEEYYQFRSTHQITAVA
ncbi:hypothetical protein SANA_25650 [Gottschalkiaceae bacterium SANA]|nr:hypothetical protein SANA_25650 [Gottschalkiaceae bacterium SANA]